MENSLLFFTSINEKVTDIAENLNNVDRYGHRHYKEDELKDIHKELTDLLDDAAEIYKKIEESNSSKNNKQLYKDINDLFSKFEENEEKLNSTTQIRQIENLRRRRNDILNELFGKFNSLSYDFKSAHDELRDNDYDDNTENMRVILLCKNVRIMEDIVNKICSNNIDKSIISGEKLFESMQYGFEWLFCHDNGNENNEQKKYQHVDIRDKNRYLDFIKYQILIWTRSNTELSQINCEVEEHDKEILRVFDQKSFRDKVALIKNFKTSVINLIKEFFEVYKLLINFRDKIFIEEEIRKSVCGSIKKTESARIITERPKLSKDIVVLSTVALRVLIDRFVSFVKINDLNFGNSTFNRSWFNYSELSNSNYAGSNFKYSRLENAKVKDCDISTCNLSCADGSGTDFSDSNFDYSNMTGMNLSDAILNKCQFKNTLFRDTGLDVYKPAVQTLKQQHQEILENSKLKRIGDLLNVWGNEINTNEEYINSICNLYKSIKTQEIEIPLKGNVSILNLDSLTSYFDDIQIKTRQLIKCNLSKIISAELLENVENLIKYENAEHKHIRENTFGKILLDSANLTKVSAKEVQMPKMDFSHLSMSGASFEDSDLSEATMYYTKADNTSFMNTNLNGSVCFESYYESTSFSEAIANKSVFINCNLNNTNWKSAILNGITFVDASFETETCLDSSLRNPFVPYLRQYLTSPEANEEARIVSDRITYKTHNCTGENDFWQKNCSINEANFQNTLADNAVFVNILSERSSFNDSSLKNSVFANCSMNLTDFIESDFRFSIISCCSFGHSNFKNANLIKSRLQYVDFSAANLNSTLLNSAEIDHVLFVGADLSSLNVSNAIIKNCAFVDCNISGMIMYNATFENCIFDNLNFHNAVSCHSAKFKNCGYIDCRDNSKNDLLDRIWKIDEQGISKSKS